MCRKLKELTMVNLYDCSEENSISVNELRDLEKLVVSMDVTKDFIDFISCNLQELKFLDLSDCPEILDNDLESICNLPKLEELNISNLKSITGSGLGNNFPNLKKFHCSSCVKLKDNHLMRLLRCAPKLELIDLTYCKGITNAVVNFAIKITNKRTNNTALEMLIEETNIDLYEIKNKSPRLFLFPELD